MSPNKNSIQVVLALTLAAALVLAVFSPASSKSLFAGEATPLEQTCTQWNLAADYRLYPNQENPNPDSCGNPAVWHFMAADYSWQNYTLLTSFDPAVLGIPGLQQWERNPETDELPVVGINATGGDLNYGWYWPAGAVNVHPGQYEPGVVGWRSPINGVLSIGGFVQDMDPNGGDGIDWFIDRNSVNLASGSIDNGGAQNFTTGTGGYRLSNLTVRQGDFLYFIIHPDLDGYGDYSYDSTWVDIQIQLVEAPSWNDNFSDARLITEMPFGDYRDITNATVETGELLPTCTSGSGYQTLWYQFTPSAEGLLTFSTLHPDAPSFAAVYTGDNFSNLVETGCQAGWPLQLTLQAGTTYSIQVGSLNPGVIGELDVWMTYLVRPTNDDFANARVVSSFPYTDSQQIALASIEAGEQLASCVSIPYTSSIWYAYTPTAPSIWTAQTSSPFFNYIAFWSGNVLGSLTEMACSVSWTNNISVSVRPGVTYYIQTGNIFAGEGYLGYLSVDLDLIPRPPNDDFVDAQPVDVLPFYYTSNLEKATFQAGEPWASCAHPRTDMTVWFSYTPTENRQVTVRLSNPFWDNYLAVYTGDMLENLSELYCSNHLQFNPITFSAQTGTTYYFQVGRLYGWDYGGYTFELDYTPPPIVSFGFSPGDPSVFDAITFWDTSYDPGNVGFSDSWWDFGDGSTAVGNPVTHPYTADGDYTVWHKVQTHDGRAAESTQVIQVRTHDVAITKFNPPESARAGQTKAITVGLRNTRYPETVVVELYKSTPSGFVFVGSLEKSVPVRPSNRTTDFIFNYTFTLEDALQGKVTFKAIAYIQGYRDPLSADNEAIALPTIVRR